MNRPQFDQRRLSLAKDRATKRGGDLFLYQRAFDDLVERLQDLPAPVARALLVGCPDPDWIGRLSSHADEVTVVESGASWAERSGTKSGRLGEASLEPKKFDIAIVVGELHHSPDPKLDAFVLRHALKPGGRLLGVIPGSRSLPRLRKALMAADRPSGQVSHRIAPLMAGSTLAQLLGDVGLTEVVIEVEQVAARYPSLDRLVDDLRGMACTNHMAGNARPLDKQGLRIAREAFLDGNDRAVEHFELLHFYALAPGLARSRRN